MNAHAVIEVSGLNKYFGEHHVVRDLSLTVNRGEIFGFLGPNGSGKTTSIRMLCGLLRPDSGQGRCLGHDLLTETAWIKREVGYMTQRFSLWEDLTIEENLLFVARMYGMPQRKRCVHEALNTLGLYERRGQLAGQLSGGWKQRLALASCLLHEPQLLLLDEPTAGVDPKARREFWDEIHELAARGISILVSTHYMDEAERCHRLAYIAQGQLLASGTGEEIVQAQNLGAWRVSGGDLHALALALKAHAPAVACTTFGNALHVTSQQRNVLQALANQWQGKWGCQWVPIKAGLEDVFIALMGGHS